MLISVKVFAGAPRQVVIVESKRLKVFVREPAQAGAANKAVMLALAGHFGVSPSNIRIVRGQKGPNKVLEVKGLEK